MSASAETAASKKGSKESAASASSSAAPKAAVDKADAKTPLFPVTPDWKKVPLHERIVVDAACAFTCKERERERKRKAKKIIFFLLTKK
jgi:hypothetical protein